MDCARLIELVKVFPQIYDNNRQNYGSRSEVYKAWTIVAENLKGGYTADECETQFKKLRKQFVREHKKYCELQSLLSEFPTWKYYKRLEFLTGHITHRQSQERPQLADILRTLLEYQ